MKSELSVLVSLIIPFVLFSSANGKEKGSVADSLFTPGHLTKLVVAYPDSVLTLLDIATSRNLSQLPDYRINLLRGVAYNEKRMFSLCEKYAKRALDSDSIKRHPKMELQALTMLSNVQNYFGDYQSSTATALKGIDLARASGNRPSEFNFLGTMADISFKTGKRDQGYDYLNRIIENGAPSDNIRELANVSSALGSKVLALSTEGRYAEAIDEGRERLELARRAAIIQDSLYLREKANRAQELASLFELNEKEAQLSKSKAEAEQRKILFLSSMGVATIILLVMIFLWIENRNIMRRNRIAGSSGYSSRNTYYQHFNKFYGITPAQYRKKSADKSAFSAQED